VSFVGCIEDADIDKIKDELDNTVECELVPYGHCSGEDFSGQDLSELNLTGIDLSYANLSGANLTNLNYANLTGANLTGAILTDAELEYAVLIGANLYYASINGGANLHGAELIGADLTGANLTGANLHYAHFTDAIVTDTDFTDTYWYDTTWTDAVSYHENQATAEEEVDDTPSLRSAVDKFYGYLWSNITDYEGYCGMFIESDGKFLNSSAKEECVDEWKMYTEYWHDVQFEWNKTYRNYTEMEVMDFKGVVREVTVDETFCEKYNTTEWYCEEAYFRMIWALVDGKWGFAENELRDYCKSAGMSITERFEDNEVFQCERIEANVTLPVDKISDGYSGHYIIEVIAISEQHNLSSYTWYLLDNMGNTYDGGKVYGINMNYSGDDEVLQNRSINISNDNGGWRFPAHFLDNDLDGMLSAGDQFLLYDTDYDRYGQTRTLEDGYQFRLKLDITGDVIHYRDMLFGNMNKDISGDS